MTPVMTSEIRRSNTLASSPTPKLRDHAAGGTGMLAIFCDLAAADQADFRPWLMEDMFPPRRAIGFTACASFDLMGGEGRQFVTLYEMPSLGHLYGEPYQALRRTRKPRDAAYHEKFQNPERYTLSWTGPEWVGPELGDSEAGGRGAEGSGADGREPRGFSPHILIDRFDLTPEGAQAFNIAYATEYLPGLAGLAGVSRVRRYLAMEGTPSHVIVHDLTEPSVIESPEWSALRAGFGDVTSGLYQRVIEAD